MAVELDAREGLIVDQLDRTGRRLSAVSRGIGLSLRTAHRALLGSCARSACRLFVTRGPEISV